MEAECLCGGSGHIAYDEYNVPYEPAVKNLGDSVEYTWPGSDCTGCGRLRTDYHVVAAVDTFIAARKMDESKKSLLEQILNQPDGFFFYLRWLDHLKKEELSDVL